MVPLNTRCSYQHRLTTKPRILLWLLLSLYLPLPSFTQLTSSDDSPTTTIFSPSPPTTTTTHLFPTPSIPTRATYDPLPTPTATALNPTEISDDLPRTTLINYYFLLLFLLILIFLFLVWTFHRRRKQKRAASRNNRHNALARDLEGWLGNRRWVSYGGNGGRGWRDVIGGGGGGQGQRQEGLDERGEAPPPYEYVLEEPGPVRVVGRSRSGSGEGGGQTRGRGDWSSLGSTPDIALHSLERRAEEGKPPDYERT
ncbi:hypothetical protein MMC16_004506 [Acarospora aff. strigata]|nr:hypothetical protein [Acarospora aff. strigata]